jgi:hypothetical protein
MTPAGPGRCQEFENRRHQEEARQPQGNAQAPPPDEREPSAHDRAQKRQRESAGGPAGESSFHIHTAARVEPTAPRRIVRGPAENVIGDRRSVRMTSVNAGRTQLRYLLRPGGTAIDQYND